LAKEIKGASIAGSSRTCSNGGSGKNKYDNGTPSTERRICTMKPICYGDG